MKKRFFNNWLLKLSSVAIAVVLWVVVYNINDPVNTSTIRNVPVTFINTEAITDKGQVYEVLNGTDVIRSITMSATRSVLDDLESGDINVEADFSKMKLDGTVEIKIYSDRHNDVITFKPSSSEVKLLVEDKVERYFSLEVELNGSPKEGYIVGNSKLDWNRITVSGAESKVDVISKAKAVVDISDTSGDIFSYANIVLYDDEGKEVPKDNISLNMRTVGTTVEILKTKKVPIIYASEGVASEGYVTTGEVTSDVNEVTIAGKESVISSVTEIAVEGEALYFTEAEGNVALTVDLDDYLPAGIIRADKKGNGRVEVMVHVAPIIEKEFRIPMGQIQIENVPEGYSVVHVLGSTEIPIVVRGAEHLLKELNTDVIKGSFDVTAWMEANNLTKLKNQEAYIVEPVYEVSEDYEVISTAPIEIIANVLEE